MLRALSAAASGMEAQELKVEIIAHNLSNVNTTGYKKMRAEFQDLLYETVRAPGTTDASGSQVPTGMQIGRGVRPVATLRQFTMGDVKQTGNVLDVAIEGPGFFQISMPDGQIGYSRDGSLKTDGQGRLVNSDGLTLEPKIVFPSDTRNISISVDGSVSVTTAGRDEPVVLGQIELVNFANPAGLQPLGHNLFSATPAAGSPIVARPGNEGTGTLGQGMLEMSNVKVVEEMVDLITTQRAYETNSKVIQAADEMLRSTASLR